MLTLAPECSTFTYIVLSVGGFFKVPPSRYKGPHTTSKEHIPPCSFWLPPWENVNEPMNSIVPSWYLVLFITHESESG